MPSCPSISANYIVGIYLQTLSADTYVTSNSGYTLATPVVCSLSTIPSMPLATILNDFNLIVAFGNNTTVEITQPTNSLLITEPVIYNWPGVYEVKLSIVPKNGCPLYTYTKTFSAYNFIVDKINWNYSEWPELTTAALASGALFHGFQSCTPGNLGESRSLTIDYTVSNTVSADLIFNLYSENSLSQPWKLSTVDNKYAQLRPRWRFTDVNDNYIESISSTMPTPVYVNSLGVSSVSGTLVGYTGKVSFKYIDDIPSLNYSQGTGWSVQTPRLWATYNTTKIPNLQNISDGFSPSYSNSKIQLSANYYVKNLSATHFNISLNGGTIPFSKTIWPGSINEFFVTVNSNILSAYESFSNKTLLNYPLQNIPGQNVLLKVVPAAAGKVGDNNFTFDRYNALGYDTGGYNKNFFTALPLSSSLLSSGTLTTILSAGTKKIATIVEPPPYSGNYTVATRASQATTYNSLSTLAFTGQSTFNIVNFYKKYFTRKINENFNYGEQLKSYALQPFIADNSNLFLFLSAIAGDNIHPDENFGTVVYEKISNFVSNNNDLHTCNVDQLYSLADLINNSFDNFNLTVPPALKREFDLYSAPHERLWGNREKYNTNFNVLTDHTNLGVELTAYNINTAIISAGQKIVLNDIFNSNFYEVLEVPVVTSYASVTARNLNTYFSPTATYPLSSYPLSAFFGWGVKTPVRDYYRFYYYNPVFTNIPVNNLIDWNTRTEGLSTTLSETASSVDEWYKDGGILENIYSYYISKGLGFTK